MTYPTWTDGDLVTAERCAAGLVQRVIKTGDQAMTDEATYINDSELFLPVVAGATYLVEMGLGAVDRDGGTNGDIAWTWELPEGTITSSFRHGQIALPTTAASVVDTNLNFSNGPNAGTYTSAGMLLANKILVIGTGGTLHVRWRQRVAATTNLYVVAGSWLSMERVA